MKWLMDMFKPYAVMVLWEDATYFHGVWDTTQAMEWAQQYPADATVLVVDRSGEVLMGRGPGLAMLEVQ